MYQLHWDDPTHFKSGRAVDELIRWIRHVGSRSYSKQACDFTFPPKTAIWFKVLLQEENIFDFVYFKYFLHFNNILYWTCWDVTINIASKHPSSRSLPCGHTAVSKPLHYGHQGFKGSLNTLQVWDHLLYCKLLLWAEDRCGQLENRHAKGYAWLEATCLFSDVSTLEKLFCYSIPSLMSLTRVHFITSIISFFDPVYVRVHKLDTLKQPYPHNSDYTLTKGKRKSVQS